MSDTMILTSDPTISVRIILNATGNPPGKLADAELHFTTGLLHDLKLIGFSIWERRGGAGLNVTFPARSYTINAERRSFALLRPLVDTSQTNRVRDAIIEAYKDHVQAVHAEADPHCTCNDCLDAHERQSAQAIAADMPKAVCPNCGQWQRPTAMGLGAHLDCVNDCARRGLTAMKDA